VDTILTTAAPGSRRDHRTLTRRGHALYAANVALHPDSAEILHIV